MAHRLPLVEPEDRFDPHPLIIYLIVPNPPIMCSIESNMFEKRPRLGQLHVEIRNHFHVVTPVRENVRTFEQTPESINMWYVSKPYQRRLKSI
jgi:hypothetical protein